MVLGQMKYNTIKISVTYDWFNLGARTFQGTIDLSICVNFNFIAEPVPEKLHEKP